MTPEQMRKLANNLDRQLSRLLIPMDTETYDTVMVIVDALNKTADEIEAERTQEEGKS